MKKYLYALDLSMSNTGIAIFDTGNLEPMHITSVKTKKHKGIDEQTDHKLRLKIITDKFDELLESYPVGEVAIESPFVMHNKSTKAVMKVHGITQRWFNDVEQYFYAPTTIKATIVNGKASKEALKIKIEMKFPNIVMSNEDESDAVAIGITHLLKVHKLKWK